MGEAGTSKTAIISQYLRNLNKDVFVSFIALREREIEQTLMINDMNLVTPNHHFPLSPSLSLFIDFIEH